MFTGLIIDEQRNQHKMLRPVIEQHFGRQPDSAYTLKDAEELLVSKRYDFVIIDPTTDGLAKGLNSILDAKRRGNIAPYCVLLILSADSSAKFVAACADLQPDDLLIKPTKAVDLVDRLQAALDRKMTIKLPYSEFERTGRNSDAQRLFDQSMKLAKSGTQKQFLLKSLANFHLASGQITQAQQSISKLHALNDGPQAKLLAATLLLAKEKEQEAIQILEDMLKTHPMLLPGYDLLAEAGYKTGNGDLGLRARAKANSINPLNASRSLKLSNEAFELGDLDVAKDTIQYQLDHMPDLDPSARFAMLAQIHLAQDDLDSSLKVLEAAQKRMGSAFVEKSPQLTIALLRAAIGQGKTELAKELLVRLTSIDEAESGPKDYLFESAICAYELADYDQGDHWLERVLSRQSLSFSQFQRIKEAMKERNLSDRLQQITLKAGRLRASHNERQRKFKEAGLYFEMAQELVDIAEHPDADIETMQQAMNALALARQHGQLHQAVDLVVQSLEARILALGPTSTQESALRRSLSALASS